MEAASKKPCVGTRLLAYRGHSKDAPGHTYAWSPDGSRLVTGCNNGLLKIWSAETGELILTCEDCSVAPINAVVWSPDGSRLTSASGDKIALVWDASSGRCLFAYQTVWPGGCAPECTRVASASGDTTVD